MKMAFAAWLFCEGHWRFIVSVAFRNYKTMNIHLLGDKFRAQSFLWFAKKKLAEMKMVMGLTNLKFGNRAYQLPDGSVQVYVESYLGVEKIRITAASGGCGQVFITADVVEGSSPLTVNFTSTVVGFTPTYYWWTFGDAISTSESVEANPSHIYTDTGTFTVNLIVFGQSSATGLQNIGASVFTFENKNASGASDAIAHANFIAAPWSAGPRGSISLEYQATKTGGGTVTYFATRINGFASQAFGGNEYFLQQSNGLISDPAGTMDLKVNGTVVHSQAGSEGLTTLKPILRVQDYTSGDVLLTEDRDGMPLLNPTAGIAKGWFMRGNTSTNHYLPDPFICRASASSLGITVS
jgi:PKD repeat protein